MWGVEWAVVLAMILFNSVFAAYEIALASVSLARLEVLVREKRPGAKAAFEMKERMEASLAVVQVGITLVGAIGAAASGAGALEMIAPWFQRRGVTPGLAEFFAIAIVVVPLSAVTIVCGELVPKVFALRNKEWVCLQLSPTMRWFAFCVWPAVWLFERIVTAFMNWGERRWQSRLDAQGKPEADTLQELRAIAALARTSRLIGGREEGIILNAARLSSRSVREIVLPPEHIAMLSLSNSMADGLVAAHLDMHTRFPVTAQAGDSQAIVGYVNFKDIVAQLRLSPDEPSLRGILRPLTSLADSLPIASCLERIPYLLADVSGVQNLADAFFEAMSGFTTTGATVVTGLDHAAPSILFWRAMTQWLGGMGIIVLSLAILPFLGVGGMQLFEAESPGPTKDRLSPRIQDTAKVLWGVYAILTLAETVLLWAGGMNGFESVCHAFTTMATGGFSTRDASIAAFGSYTHVVIGVFMLLAGVNFSLHFHALRGDPRRYWQSEEFRFYLALIASSTAVITVLIMLQPGLPGHVLIKLRDAAFQTVSLMTTTGFATADFETWPAMAQYILVALMFVGGCRPPPAAASRWSACCC